MQGQDNMLSPPLEGLSEKASELRCKPELAHSDEPEAFVATLIAALIEL